jgi:hypothetical protein
LLWPRLAAAWPSLPRRVQRRVLRASAQTLHTLWQQGFDLQHIPLELWAVQGLDNEPSVKLPPMPVAQRRRPLPRSAILELLADWNERTPSLFSTRDRISFLYEFLQSEAADRLSLIHI